MKKLTSNPRQVSPEEFNMINKELMVMNLKAIENLTIEISRLQQYCVNRFAEIECEISKLRVQG